MIVAWIVLSALGTGSFDVDAFSTDVPYTQSAAGVQLTGNDAAGGGMGGEFLPGPIDASGIGGVGLELSVQGTNRNSGFFVEFYSGDGFDIIATYFGGTTGVGTEPSVVPLELIATGSGTWSDLRGLQFTWDGNGESVNVTLRSVVCSAPEPVIASMSYAGGQFAMTWTGTGAMPVDVERRAALDAGTWERVAEGVVTGQFTDVNPPPGRGFYRVVVP